MEGNNWLKGDVHGFLFDLYGVIYECHGTTDVAIPGSVEAINKLRKAGIPMRFCSNVSTRNAHELAKRLQKLGYEVYAEEMCTPIPAVLQYLRKHSNLRPFLIVDPAVEADFAEFDQSNPNCVVIADAQDRLSYENINRASQILLQDRNAQLISLGMGSEPSKYYKEVDGPKLDAGTFAKALEFACDVKAVVLGKPFPGFFLAALESLKLEPQQVVMVGDDIYLDIEGAQSAGIRNVLVRTGVYKPHHETHEDIKADGYADNLLQVVDIFLKNKASS